MDCGSLIRGYTQPQNQAMAAGRGEFLLAMNDDIEVTPGWIDPLLAQARSGTWCTTPDMTHTDGPQVFAPYCQLWRQEAWNLMGGLDERFFLWASDIDIARRLVDAGQPPVRVALPVPIRHELNATCVSYPQLAAECVADLQRFRDKWGIEAEVEKHRLAALTP